MTVKSIVSSFLAFAAHYAKEADAIEDVLSSLVDALPIQPADKARYVEKLDTLRGGVSALVASLRKFENSPPVVEIRKSDIDAAVKPLVEEGVSKEVAEALAAVDFREALKALVESVVAEAVAALPKPEAAPANTGGAE